MGVIIGMDPHKRSATIEVIDERARVLAVGRYGTDKAGYARDAQRRAAGSATGSGRSRAATGSAGTSRTGWSHDGETVVDVPAKLSAQVRVFATGNGRKTDPVDAHSVALVALRTPNLVQVEVDPDLVVMGLLVDRRDELGRARTQTINRLHRLLLELVPGGAKQFLSARAGPGADRDHQTARHRRQDPAPARGRADRRARGHRPEDQGRKKETHRHWSRPRTPR